MEVYKPILIFLATAAVSGAGSVQLGAVNLMVVQTTLRFSRRAGLWVALGGCLPEIFYAALAVWAGMWLNEHPSVWFVLEWAVVPILLVLAIITFKTPEKPSLENPQTTNKQPFVKGFTLGLLNPQLFPYWLVMLVQFGSYGLLRVETWPQQLAFVLGTACGAFAMLVFFAYFTARKKEKILLIFRKINVNKLLGILFGLLALSQFIKLL